MPEAPHPIRQLPERGPHDVLVEGHRRTPRSRPSRRMSAHAAGAPLGDVLSGEQIVDTALALLGDRPAHHREWLAELRAAGYDVAGKDPLAVVCANLHRHALVMRVGDGIFQRDTEAVQRLADTITRLRASVVEHIDCPVRRDPLIRALRRAERTYARHGGGAPTDTGA